MEKGLEWDRGRQGAQEAVQGDGDSDVAGWESLVEMDRKGRFEGREEKS